MHEIVIKKSTFISYVYEVQNKDQINQIIANLRKEYKKARHICSAYVLEDQYKNLNGGYDDDGEPKNTAGMPIFDLIQIKNIKNVLVVVIRYFGGVKLGASGLIRAYRKSANVAIDEYLKEKNNENSIKSKK
ncbi:YigZ family protein [Mycoplasmopsis ciconiae]|uniref:YigZ family protein n=1 Tax=Mycoplasmopsis ciconiae TaxID=561067 RepID=A0ABU7MLR6_9BACT|nr:YigZ family protein [Mycoplasmopsis ciconiae]